jgi:hypothetical protein
MRQVQINRNLILREDGKLFNVHTGEEFVPVSNCKNPRGCRYYRVVVNGKHKTVHSLVMQYFGPPKPGPEYQIDHENRNSHDNRIDNLKWVTRQENMNNQNKNLPEGHRRKDLPKKEYDRECTKRSRERKKRAI